MANFILLHGAWHWGGCFQKLVTALAARGHHALAPDLAGHGFDTMPAAQITGIDRYTEPARRLIEASDRPVILLGHSMGGFGVTYLGEQLSHKISTLVYLAAFMAPRGKSAADYLPGTLGVVDENTQGIMRLVSVSEEGLRLDMSRPDELREGFYADCSAHDVAIAFRNLQAVQPVSGVFGPSPPVPENARRPRRVYIECSEDQAIPVAVQRLMQADQPEVEVLSLATSHSPFFSAPEQLADMLAALA